MARRRREGLSSPFRYQLKMYRNLGAPLNSDRYAELATLASNAMSQARTLGLGAYFTARREAREVLANRDVSSALWGLYFAYVNEYVHKVQQTKQMSRDELIDKWSRNGLDASILSEIADTISAVLPPTTQKPAKSKA